MHKVAIVGTGPAGLTAAIYCARAGQEPLVIEGMQPGGQLTTTTEVENFPGFEEGIDGTALVMNMRKQAERFGAKFLIGEVTECDFSGRPLKLMIAGGDDVLAESVVIATGASAIYLGIESEKKLIGRGVTACATCDGAFYRNLPVAVVGGGDSAMEEATFLARLCSKVTIIHRRDEFRASKIMADRALNNPKIEVIWDSVVDEVLDVQKNEVTGIKVKNLKTGKITDLTVSGLFMAIGHKPNTSAFKGAVDLDEKGFVVAQNTRTSVKGI